MFRFEAIHTLRTQHQEPNHRPAIPRVGDSGGGTVEAPETRSLATVSLPDTVGECIRRSVLLLARIRVPE